MARTFRLYGKKRGQRRSGSPAAGGAAVVAFLGVTLGVGLLLLVWMLWSMAIPQLAAGLRYEQTTCTVLKKRIAETSLDGGTAYRPELLVRYTADGRTYEVWTYDAAGLFSPERARSEEVLDRFETAAEYPCWYDPSDPRRAVLVRQASWPIWLMTLLPIAFIVIGGGGLVYQLLYAGKSQERRAALAQFAGQLDPFDQTHVVDSEYPFVPNYRAIADSPGTRLAYRLPAERSEALALFVSLAAVLATNAMSVLFVYLTIDSHRRGEPDWFLTLFTVPVILGGIATLLYFVRRLLVVGGAGPAILEISDHPLFPGRHYRLFFSYAGQARLKAIRMRLRCEERTSFVQGTNARHESRVVYERLILEQQNIAAPRGKAWEIECPLDVPAAAMHSFKADHNEIAWRVDVEATLVGWPDIRRLYYLTICPSDGRVASHPPPVRESRDDEGPGGAHNPRDERSPRPTAPSVDETASTAKTADNASGDAAESDREDVVGGEEGADPSSRVDPPPERAE